MPARAGGPADGSRAVHDRRDGRRLDGWRRTPNVLQMEASECGAVALAVVLAYHGLYMPLEELRRDCGVGRDGSRASRIVRAARQAGLQAEGLRVEPEDLFFLPLPLIAHWDFNHFVVIEGVTPAWVYLNDPETGHRRVTWEEVDRSLTGVVIVARPAQVFVPSGRPPSLAAALKERARGTHPALVMCVLAGLGLVVPGLAVPGLLRVFTDRYLSTSGTHGMLVALVGGLLAASVVSGALTWLQQATLVRLSTRLSLVMSTRFFEHVLRLPLPFFQQRHSGLVLTRLNANDRIAELLSTQFATTLLNLLTAAFFGALLFVYSWLLALVTLALVVLDVVVVRLTIGDRRESERKRSLEEGKLVAIAIGGMQSIETLKASGEESGFFERLAAQHAKLVNRRQDSSLRNAALQVFPTSLSSLTTVVVLALGGLLALKGQVSIGSLVAFQALAASFTTPLVRSSTLPKVLQEVQHEVEAVDDVMRHEEAPETSHPSLLVDVGGPDADSTESAKARQDASSGSDGSGHSLESEISGGSKFGGEAEEAGAMHATPRLAAASRPRLTGHLELRSVTFGYDPLGPPLLVDLSLEVPPGGRVAIVGSSGSGKSTVARIAAGLYRPWSGEVLLDGTDRALVPRRVIAASVAFVDQEVVLFETTVHDNVALWDPTLGRNDVTRAARDACIHDDVSRRPGGYDRMVSEGGRDWSGGQRQRLDIARALAGNPSLLILDEAMSALDPLVEREIDRNLRARGVACLVVAHRLSTVRDAEEIIVLDAGRVSERGTHDELVRRGGLYQSLVGA